MHLKEFSSFVLNMFYSLKLSLSLTALGTPTPTPTPQRLLALLFLTY